MLIGADMQLTPEPSTSNRVQRSGSGALKCAGPEGKLVIGLNGTAESRALIPAEAKAQRAPSLLLNFLDFVFVHAFNHGQQRILDKLRDIGDGGGAEQRLQRELNLKGFAQIGGHANRQQRVAPEPKEFVVNAHGTNAQQVFPYFDDALLGGIPGGNVFRADVRPRGIPPSSASSKYG